jgi:hypothetical protein
VKRRWVDIPGNSFEGIPGHRELRIYSDGEVYEMAPRNDEKVGMRNIRSLRTIFQELRFLVNANFDQLDSEKQLFITLTYAENMQDDKRLYKDYDKFIKRLKHRYKEHELAYISIVEPQGRGAWHVHLLLKTLNRDKLEIGNWDLEPIWGHGITHTERLENTDNVGAYFAAYLTNLELTDEKINELGLDVNDITEKNGKRIVKGERLKHYPAYMQIYRHSRNVTYPDKTLISYEQIKNDYPKRTFENYKEIELEDGKVLKLGKEQRKSCQGL